MAEYSHAGSPAAVDTLSEATAERSLASSSPSRGKANMTKLLPRPFSASMAASVPGKIIPGQIVAKHSSGS